MANKENTIINTTVGKSSSDTSGSPVAVIRMDPQQSYIGVPKLLQSFINEADNLAWEKIKEKIDYTYDNLVLLLEELDKETRLNKQLEDWLKEGKKLLFKPNLVSPACIDPINHSEALGYTACTGWPFIAALMRCFHDKLGISYHKMSLGEAGTGIPQTAAFYSRQYADGEKISTEAIIEGKCGSFYGGWGFYFVRKYLAENHPSSHQDDPMKGYDESIAGTYIPPGKAENRLMVYDLNRVSDIKAKHRDVNVADGVNFKNITLHKAITVGNSDNPGDIEEYPGCVLINVPRLKVHSQTLFTNAIKNIGIGLYPMELASDESATSTDWKYSYPPKYPPMIKCEIPHMPWVPQLDENSLPLRNNDGEYIVTRTYGLTGTIVDMVKAVVNLQVPEIHIVDAIFIVNKDHTGTGVSEQISEGLAFAALDVVALDHLCARYMFNNVPVAEARRLQKEHGLHTDFIQKVPVPQATNKDIITTEGYDEPLSRHGLFQYAEKRGLGRQDYYAVGWDAINEAPIVSLQGHLGFITDSEFKEIITSKLYYAVAKPLWDLQNTVLSYARSNDTLTGSSYYSQLLDCYDENNDGTIDYDEFSKKGFWLPLQRLVAWGRYLRTAEEYGLLHGDFFAASRRLKYSNEKWNPERHDFLKEYLMSCVPELALQMSKVQEESTDPLFTGMTWGNGKWPSWQFASHISVINTIYQAQTPEGIANSSLYGLALQYADKKNNKGIYTGDTRIHSQPDVARNYILSIKNGAPRLDFVLYVPEGFGKLNNTSVPNVIETDDPHLLFTAHFNNDKETW